MFENLGFSESDFSYLALGKTRKVGCEKVREKTSAISEVSEESKFSTWSSRSAELYGRICGGKMSAAISHVLASLEP